MQVQPGKALNAVEFNDTEIRRNTATLEKRFAERVEEMVFAPLLRAPVEGLSRLMRDDLVRLAQSSLPEARGGALEAYRDPAAAGVHRDLLQPLWQALGQPDKGEPQAGVVRDAGNLLRLVGTAYEKATEALERKFQGLVGANKGILAGIESALDGGKSSVAVELRLAELAPKLSAEGRATLLRVARFGQVQGAYRDGFAAKVLDLDGAANDWFLLEAFNQRTNRRRVERARLSKDAQIQRETDYLRELQDIQTTQTARRIIRGWRRSLQESAGRFRWVVLPTGVMFWLSRFFGLPEGGDISGTTADAIFVLEALLAMPEGDQVRQAFGANLPMAYLLPMVHMLKEQHHSLLEISYALTLNEVCEYVINDYKTLLPAGIDADGAVGVAFLGVCDACPARRLCFDGTNADAILVKLREKYPLSLAAGPFQSDPDRQRAEATEKDAGCDLTPAIGDNAEIWTMQTVDEIAAFRQLATCGKTQYKMFAELRDQKSVSVASVVAAALSTSRAAAMIRLCQKHP